MTSEKLKSILAILNATPEGGILEEIRKGSTTSSAKTKGRYSTKKPKEKLVKVPKEHSASMTAEQVELYLRWLNIRELNVAELCVLVKDALIKENRMLYYNINMTS